MVQLAGLIACQALNQYRVMLGAALTAGVTPSEVKEIVYQAVPYVEWVKFSTFFTPRMRSYASVESNCRSKASRRRRPRRARQTDSNSRKRSREPTGSIGCTPRREMTSSISIVFRRANCFGDYVTRSGIDIPTRQLLTFAMLVSHGGCDPQIIGHVTANLNVGNDRGMLLSVLTRVVALLAIRGP
jgi:4-carboxymuconolactone decarboxylase